MADFCSLREFMQTIMNLGAVARDSFGIGQTLANLTGLSPGKVNEYLDKLDIKYVRVKWSDGGRPIGITEIVRTDLSGLPEAPPKKEAKKILRNIGCETNWQSIIEPKQPPKPQVRKCIICQLDKKIAAKDMCGNCYQQSIKKKMGICVKCGLEKIIIAKEKCTTCYFKEYSRKSGICVNCKLEQPIYGHGKCRKCYSKDYYQNRQQSESELLPICQPS